MVSKFSSGFLLASLLLMVLVITAQARPTKQNNQGVCNLMKKCTEELDCQTSSTLSDGCFCKRRGQCKCSPKNGRCMPDMSKQLSKSSSVKRGKLLKSQITKQWTGSRTITRYLFIVASK
ncbi:uncharacterized protein [Clytia hemisphaerica]|uniref:Uncharacterized protein n=1 Tax=Clytia hemisphaerica TaxID=252671 RepID=A0A7M5UY97_9CNID